MGSDYFFVMCFMILGRSIKNSSAAHRQNDESAGK